MVRVAELISDLDTDIVALHEVTPDLADEIVRLSASNYPYRVIRPDANGSGIVLLSRYPITQHQVFSVFRESILNLKADIDVYGTSVAVYLARPKSPLGGFQPFSYDTALRDADLANLQERLESEEGPVLVLCDCNMSDQSDAYQELDRLLDDAFREVGHGFGFTFRYRSFLPYMVRIDYVWHNDYFVAIDAQTRNDPDLSDHRPMFATLILKSSSN